MTTEALLPETKEAPKAVQLAARELGEIQAQVQSARMFPRDERAAWDKLLVACARPTFADAAVYEFPRGGQKIRGLSINAAREVARVWGNIRHGYRQIPTDPAWIHIEAYAYDLETGTFVSKEDRFLKKIQRKDKGGVTRWVEPDERDQRELVGRRAAVLERNCMLELVPADLKEEMLAKCMAAGEESTGQQLGGSTGKAAALAKWLQSFGALGVSRAQLQTHLGCKFEDLTKEQFAELQRIYRAIADGQSTVEDYFQADVDAPAEPGSGG